ncbi:MAG: uncharacterized protein QG552_1641 [Thermodesulfobacteriota bacterium]|nr:uncharacterized protein [Thermodesulfobacteriota bacterium]
MPPFFSAIMVFLAVVLVSGGLGVGQGLCGDIPISESAWIGSDEPGQKAEPEFNIGTWFATSVWRHISEVDGQRCPSDPTCSSYSAQVFRKHGFFVGWVMTVDRLIHEADEGRNSPVVRRNGEFKILDPVENNDFWWHGRNKKARD